MSVLFNEMMRYRVFAKDRELGKVRDVYFDNQTYGVRFLQIAESRWTPWRQFLVPVYDVEALDAGARSIHLDLMAHEVSACLPADGARAVEAQAADPLLISSVRASRARGGTVSNLELVSCQAWLDAPVEGETGLVGRVEDFLFDDAEGFMPYVVISRTGVVAEDLALCPNFLVESFDRLTGKLRMGLEAKVYEGAPAYRGLPLTHEDEQAVWDYFLDAYQERMPPVKTYIPGGIPDTAMFPAYPYL